MRIKHIKMNVTAALFKANKLCKDSVNRRNNKHFMRFVCFYGWWLLLVEARISRFHAQPNRLYRGFCN